ncbi:MAG: SDR family oxidoreductase [Lachnospiraceae bacterium]|nr:SDR family oxidoreductase [Lachnospiraceae bacterium]
MNSEKFKRLDEHNINVSWQPKSDDYAAAVSEDDKIDINFSKILDGKVCLVTGASDGMGYTMAHLYAEHGAKLIITARRKEKLEAAAAKIAEETGAEVTPFVADASNKEDARKVMAFIREKYGRLDTLVNNAGVGDQFRAETATDDAIDSMVDINLKGPMYYCREALNLMLPQNYGNIVNVSSVNGVRPLCGSSYSAAKGGLNTLTKSIALRCVGTGVHCNALCPGFTVTPLSLRQEAVDKGDAGLAPVGSDMIPILHKRSVRNVPTFPIDQAMLALFLGSDMSRAITGQVIVCDNGQYL